MLEELHVRDLALIEESWLVFGRGMTVLTGETGAGKTVLLSALKLLMGERADSTAVRAGAPEALVEGRFDGPSETIVQRRVGADGRSRCVLDGDMATVGALAERVGPLVDLHGQHDHQALLSSSTHVGYLDRWAGEDAVSALSRYASGRSAWASAVSELKSVRERLDRSRSDAESLRIALDEIERTAPRPGEDDELEASLPALRHAEKLAEAAGEVAARLRGDGAALDIVSEAVAALDRCEGIDPSLDAIAGQLREVQILLDEVGRSAREYRDGVEHDSAALDRAQGRLSALAALKRRFGPTLDDVLATADSARERLLEVDDSERVLAAAVESEERARDALEHAAGELAAVRARCAPAFVEALGEAVQGLAMDGARFEVAFTDLPFDAWPAAGSQRVEFLYAPAPGQPARPLSRIASGGEMSRVMLALKSVLGAADEVGTLVFDEVDAGVGGATATAVGARLASLARTHQVIVVTHLAQVAAHADAHLVVRKTVGEGSASTTVVPVEGEDRVREIARMLSGSVSDAGLDHARELLDSVDVSRV